MRIKHISCWLFLFCSGGLYAAEDLSIAELIRQDQRLNELKQQLDSQVVIQLNKAQVKNHQPVIIAETPCFNIHVIELEVDERSDHKDTQTFTLLSRVLNEKNNQIIDQCIGTQSLQNLVRFAHVDNKIKQMYVSAHTSAINNEAEYLRQLFPEKVIINPNPIADPLKKSIKNGVAIATEVRDFGGVTMIIEYEHLGFHEDGRYITGRVISSRY